MLAIYFLFLFITNDALGQKTTISEVIGLSQRLMVNASNLNLRVAPSQHAEILAVLQAGTPLLNIDTTIYQYNHRKEIQSKEGFWIKVKYQDKQGFVFSPYLVNEISLLYEDSPIHKLPKVPYFYALYADNLGDRLKRVAVEQYKGEDNYSQLKNMLRVKDRKEKSYFLIASRIPLKEGIIGQYLKDVGKSYKEIRPGNHHVLYHKKTYGMIQETISFHGTGTYRMGMQLELDNPGIFVTERKGKALVHKIQELTPQLNEYILEGYTIEYFGDIDGDDKTDVILQGCSNHGCSNFLLLSGYAYANEILRWASRFGWNDGC